MCLILLVLSYHVVRALQLQDVNPEHCYNTATLQAEATPAGYSLTRFSPIVGHAVSL